ncbi:MAG: PspC domain-containing protein [Anaerolineae bacterium]|nr:PspC domain-containing protein [Anaerolineae bacterium]
MTKRLTRAQDKMFFGVCSGLAEYMNVDVVIVRLLMLLFIFMTGYGIFIYLLLAILMPETGDVPVSSKVNPFDDEEIVIH